MHICAWQSADGRVTSDHCRVTVQRLFSENFLIAWNVQKTLFDSRPMVAWPPTTLAWPFRDFFQNFPKLLETSKNVAWQPANGRVTSDHCCVTVQRLFSKKILIAWNVQKRCLTVGRRSRDLRPLSRDRSATSFKNFSNCLKRRKNVVWQSADGRVTSDHSRTPSHTASQMYISFFLFLLLLLLLLFLSAKSLTTYLLLQEWSDPGNFDIISKLGIGRRQFLILAGKFQLVDSPWGK